MKRTLFSVLALAALLVLALIVALELIDPKQLAEPLIAEVSERLDRPVALAALELSLFPVPALQAHEVRIGGPAADAPALLEVQRVSLRIALLPLFASHIVLRALEIDRPRIHLVLDAQGRPVWPRIKPEAASKSSAVAPPSAREKPHEAPPLLAVESIRVRDGEITAGSWQVSRLDLSGRLHLDRTARIELSADLPELGRVSVAHIDVEGLGTGGLDLSIEGKLQDVKLAVLRKRLDLKPDLEGQAHGEFAANLHAGTIRSARLDLAAEDVGLRSGEFMLAGPLTLQAALGGPLDVDLTRARIAFGSKFHKPAGLKAGLRGKLGPRADRSALEEVILEIGPDKIPLAFDLAARTPRLRLGPAGIQLEPLARLLQHAPEKLAGTLLLDVWKITPAPLALRGNARLKDVSFQLPHGPVSIQGPLRANARRLLANDLVVGIGGQTARVSGTYDLDTGRISLDSGLEGADLAALAQALVASQDLAGTLKTRFSLEGPPRLASLSGSGNVEIRDGRIRGFSLLRQVFGDLAALPVLVAQLKGKDLSRYEEEEFQRLAGELRLRQGRMYSDDLTLEYRHSTARLHGSIGLLDGSLDLGGRIVLAEDVDAAIAGQPSGHAREILIEGISGTVRRPHVRIDRKALARLASSYLERGALRGKLEEKIGKEGAQTVEDLFDQLLRRK